MNRTTSPSTEQHQQILLLLPWYLNQSLEQNELRQVKNHLRSCIVCNRELAALRKVAAAVNQPSILDVAAEASFAGFRAKLQTAEPVRQNRKPSNNRSSFAWFGNAANRYGRFLHFLSGSTVKHLAVAASILLAMVPLTMQYERSPVTPDYFTLSAAKPESPSGAKLRVVFSKSLPDAGIDSLLEKIHGQIVDGPNSVGAYTVKLGTGKDSRDSTAAISFLRNQQNVMLAEPAIDP